MSSLIDYEINKELGECYLMMGDYAKARDYYAKAIATGERFAAPHMGMAAIEIQEGNMEAAHACYTNALAAEQTEKALIGLALVEMETGAAEAAFEHYGLALDLDPANMMALNGIVQCSHYLNRLEDVLGRLESALGAEDPDPVRFALAGCLTSLGREPEARAHLEILLGRNPQYICAQELYASIAA